MIPEIQRTMAYIAADLANNDHIGYDYELN